MSNGNKKSPNMLWAMTYAFTIRYLRSKVALFFTIVFPLIFLVIFGGIFGGNSGPNFSIAVLSESDTEFAKGFEGQLELTDIFDVSDATTLETAEELLGRGEIDGIVQLPKSFGELNDDGRPSGEIELLYDESDQQLSQTLIAVMQSVADGINSDFLIDNVPFTVAPKPIQTANLSQFDYTLSGIIGFSILGLGIFSMANGFTSDKKTGALRRLRVAPIKARDVIIATAINRILIGVLTVAVMIVVSLIFFDFNMRGDYFNFFLFSIIGTVLLFGFGMAIAGWAKDDIQAAPLSNLISFPMMFLSGVFFPRFLMPEWLQGITTYIPLTPVVDGLRLIMTEGRTIFDLGPQLAIIGVWTVVIYAIAFRTFRWE